MNVRNCFMFFIAKQQRIITNVHTFLSKLGYDEQAYNAIACRTTWHLRIKLLNFLMTKNTYRLPVLLVPFLMS